MAGNSGRTKSNKQHEHNALAVAALQRDLKRIGGEDFVVALHHFTHRGRTWTTSRQSWSGANSRK